MNRGVRGDPIGEEWWSNGIFGKVFAMRQLRNFQTDRCYHLVSRVAHRAFYLNEEERTRFVERMRCWVAIEATFPSHVPRLLSRGGVHG